MTSFLGSYKTDWRFFKTGSKSEGPEGKGPKRQEKLGSSLFRLIYNKKLWHEPQTQSKTNNWRTPEYPNLPRDPNLPHFIVIFHETNRTA